MNNNDEINKLINCTNPTNYGKFVKVPCNACISCQTIDIKFHEEIENSLNLNQPKQQTPKCCDCCCIS